LNTSCNITGEMSNLSSPTRFDAENRLYDLEEKIRIPLSMKMSDDHSFSKDDSMDMFVPDRILVVGQDKFFGTTAPPRELRLENSVHPHPPEPSLVNKLLPKYFLRAFLY